MAQTGYTPIQLYHSTTAAAAPTAGNLANGELAINITDGKLYYKDNGGNVQLLASKAGAAGDVVGPASATDNALVRFDATTGKLVQNSAGILDDSGNLTGIAALTTSGALTLNGGTSNGVAYLNGSKVLTTGSALTFDGGPNLSTGGSNASTYNTFNVNNTASNGFARMLLNIGSNGANGIGAVKYAPGIFFAIGTDSDSSSTPMVFNLGNASEQMRLTSTGLGIGTSSPTFKLQVSADSSAGVGGQINLRNGAARAIGNKARISFQPNSDYTSTIVGAYIQGVDTAGDPSNPCALVFGTGGGGTPVDRMTLDSSGNLGLGVTPSAWSGVGSALELKGNAYIASTSQVLSLATNAFYNGSNWIYKSSSYANLYETVFGQHRWSTAPSGTAGNAISFTQAMTLDASGNLLVGTTSSSARVFSKVTDGSTSFAAAGTTKGVRITHSSTSSLIEGVDQTLSASYQPLGLNASDIRFSYSGTEAARITSGGDLLVGTTSSAGRLTVRLDSTTASPQYIVNAAATGTFIKFEGNGSVLGSITFNGSNTAYNTSSDYRLKNITGPITNSGAYIDSLKPVEGTWKADGSTFVGLIAHEVQEVSRTQVATGEKDGAEMQAMDYSSAEIIANLIAEVQSLRKRLAAAGIA